MVFRNIVGQEPAVRLLSKALSGARLAHAYLFYGPPGVGKKHTALQFVKALYCLASPPAACDTCTSCRKIVTGNHPDVTLIVPADTSITIEQVRALQRQLGYKPYENRRATIIMDGCEFLTPPAANALLKTLEEPPLNTLLLLLTGNKEALPLTIISRCQLVPFRQLTPEHLCTILEQQGIDAEKAAFVAALAEGRLDQLAEADVSQALAVRQCAYDMLQDVAQARGLTPFLQARKLAGKREQCEQLLRWLTLFCRDLTMLKVAPTAMLYNHDLRSALIALAQHLPLEPLLDTFDLIQQFRAYLHMHINPQLLFEQLLIQLQQALALPRAPHQQPPPLARGPRA
jgi:DNA polymerase-3 subunit delta'